MAIMGFTKRGTVWITPNGKGYVERVVMESGGYKGYEKPGTVMWYIGPIDREGRLREADGTYTYKSDALRFCLATYR